MRGKTFYPEVVLKVIDIDRENFVLTGITDNGEKVKVNIMNRDKKPTIEEFENFIREKAKKAVSKTMVDAIVDKISDSPIADKIEKEIVERDPSLTRNIRQFTNVLLKRLKEEAEKIAFNMYLLDKDMIIKIGAITNKDGNILTSRMNFDLKGINNNPGFYIVSVPNRKNPLFKKIPLKLIPTIEYDKYRAVTNSAFMEFEDFKDVLRMYLKTLKAYEEGKVNAKPGLYISFRKKDNEKFPDNINKLLFVLNEFNENQKKDSFSYKEAVKYLKTIVEGVEQLEDKNVFLSKAGLFLPLAPVKLDVETLLKDVKEKMMRTTFKNGMDKGYLDYKMISDVFKFAFVDKHPVFVSSYKLTKRDDKFGFFPNAVTMDNVILSSSSYNKILEQLDVIREQNRNIKNPKFAVNTSMPDSY